MKKPFIELLKRLGTHIPSAGAGNALGRLKGQALSPGGVLRKVQQRGSESSRVCIGDRDHTGQILRRALRTDRRFS